MIIGPYQLRLCNCSFQQGRLRTDDSSDDSNDIDTDRPCSSKANDATSDGSSRDNGFRYRWPTHSSDATVEPSKVGSLTVSSRDKGCVRSIKTILKQQQPTQT